MTDSLDGSQDATLPPESAEGVILPSSDIENIETRKLMRVKTIGALAAIGVTGGAVATAGAALAAKNIPQGVLREYWIQADSFQHNLVPTGTDGLQGTKYTADQTTYWAVGYRAYTTGWEKLLPGNNDIGENTGIPGPVLRGRVGDTIRVHFHNNDAYYRFAHSMHPHGVLYTPLNDGAWKASDPNKPGTAIKFGESYTYEWKVIPSSVGTWPYHEHSLPAQITTAPSAGTNKNNTVNAGGKTDSMGKSMDMVGIGGYAGIMELGAELGLFGMFVLTDEHTRRVDREIFLFFHDIYKGDVPVLAQDFDCFNGYSFLGNTPTFRVKLGERVRWHIVVLGKLSTSFHIFHLDGHRWLWNSRYVDAIPLGAAMTTTFEYVEDNPGVWLYSSQGADHTMLGMSGYYVVEHDNVTS